MSLEKRIELTDSNAKAKVDNYVNAGWEITYAGYALVILRKEV